MNAPRYKVAHANGKPFPCVLDTKTGHYCYPGKARASLWDCVRTAREWNTGILTPHEARTIADHFLIAAAWADAPEGTHPRAPTATVELVESIAREFVEAIGLPLFRACLDAYENHGLHPDCNGEACAAFGHDLYLTTAGHGAGFWDREALAWDHSPEDSAHLGLAKGQTIGDRITQVCGASKWEGLHGLEFYRGWIYLR